MYEKDIEEIARDWGLDISSEEDLKIIRDALKEERSIDDFVVDVQFLDEDIVDEDIDMDDKSIEEIARDWGLDISSEENLKIVRDALKKERSIDDFVLDAQFLDEDIVDEDMDMDDKSIEEIARDWGLDISSEENLKIVRNAIRKESTIDDFVLDAQFLNEDIIDEDIDIDDKGRGR